jgi:hypothetical protein
MNILKWVVVTALLPLFILIAGIIFFIQCHNSINTSVSLS